MTEDEAKIIASQFFRSLLRGETPSGPQGPLPPSVRWLDSDPEWQRKFQEAYRAEDDWRPKNANAQDIVEHWRRGPQGSKPFPVEDLFGKRIPQSPDAYWRPGYEQKVVDWLSTKPEEIGRLVYDSPLGGVVEELDKQYPTPRPQWGNARIGPDGIPTSDRYTIPPHPTDDPGFLEKLPNAVKRINPVELAKNLASRVNAGPMNPWDFFPGGLDGYLRYLAQHNAGMGAFVGSADEDWSGEF